MPRILFNSIGRVVILSSLFLGVGLLGYIPLLFAAMLVVLLVNVSEFRPLRPHYVLMGSALIYLPLYALDTLFPEVRLAVVRFYSNDMIGVVMASLPSALKPEIFLFNPLLAAPYLGLSQTTHLFVSSMTIPIGLAFGVLWLTNLIPPVGGDRSRSRQSSTRAETVIVAAVSLATSYASWMWLTFAAASDSHPVFTCSLAICSTAVSIKLMTLVIETTVAASSRTAWRR